MASTPSSYRLPCAARPAVSTVIQAKPLCATQTLSAVGSVTIAAPAGTSRTTACVPRLAYSSSATIASTTSHRVDVAVEQQGGLPAPPAQTRDHVGATGRDFSDLRLESGAAAVLIEEGRDSAFARRPP